MLIELAFHQNCTSLSKKVTHSVTKNSSDDVSCRHEILWIMAPMACPVGLEFYVGNSLGYITSPSVTSEKPDKLLHI